MDSNWEAEIVRPTTAIDEQTDKELADKKKRDQMLKLVSKGFYNELINYGVQRDPPRAWSITTQSLRWRR